MKSLPKPTQAGSQKQSEETPGMRLPGRRSRPVPAHTPRFRQLLEDARERVKETGGVEHEAFRDLMEEGGVWRKVNRLGWKRRGGKAPDDVVPQVTND